MKLKTLKDMQEKGSEDDFVNCSVVSAITLKKEAIKHIKSFEEDIYIEKTTVCVSGVKISQIKHKINWIKEFLI